MQKLEVAIEALKNGKVIIFPTETVYGLGACVHFPQALKQIFILKKRPFDNPLIVHINNLEQALYLVEKPPELFFRLAEKFWPGPLAIVLKKQKSVSDVVSASQPSIALRMPKHPIALELIAKAGPIAAPSANLSGKPSPTCLNDALEDLGAQVEIAIDGGPCEIGIESTVVSLLEKTPVLLRLGHISASQIEEVLGCQVTVCTSKTGPILSPGMKYRHYAPKAPVRLVYEEKDLQGPMILRSFTSKTLYAELRRCDREDPNEIEIYCDSLVQSNEALMDRLLRAASK